ncbi:hypothetical protein STXM2123_3589 [Streptomyces sp. F-3]|nr:hypothetical protein STXM2123_3589 [Streptomyces sp. F-3]
MFGDLGVQVVLEHPQSGFLLPSQGAQFRAPRRSHPAGGRPVGPGARAVGGDGRAGS